MSAEKHNTDKLVSRNFSGCPARFPSTFLCRADLHSFMASSISKRCLGVHYSQLTARATDSSWIFSGARATCGRNAFRPYATAVKQRPQSTAKGSARGPALNPGSTPKQLTKRAAKASQGAATSITQVNNAAAESQVSSRIPATSTSTASTVVKTSSALRSSSKRGAVPVKSEEAIEDREMTEEEQMAQVDQIMNMSRIFPTADPWGQRVDTLGGFFVIFFRLPPSTCVPHILTVFDANQVTPR